MVVDLPAPFGPRKPKNCRRDAQIDAVHGNKFSETAGQGLVEMVGARSIQLPNLAHPPILARLLLVLMRALSFFAGCFFCIIFGPGMTMPTNPRRRRSTVRGGSRRGGR